MMFGIVQEQKKTQIKSADSSEKDLNTESVRVIKTITLCLKNYILYPEEHTHSSTSISGVHEAFQLFFEFFDSLSFNIYRDGIYYDSEKLIDYSGDDDGFIGPLFRDGVLSLEFLPGINIDQISTFFKILKKNRVLPDEPDSDIVTDLWQAALPDIKYQAAEVFWDTEPLFVFPKPSEESDESSVGDGTGNENGFAVGNESSEGGNSVSGYDPVYFEPVSIANLGFMGEDLTLNQEEMNQLQQMVTVEERYDSSDDILELYLFVMDEINSPEDLRNVLINLAEEFFRVLCEGKVYQALRIIEKVKKFEKTSVCEIIPVKIEVMDFYKRLSGTLFSDALITMIPGMNRGDDEYLFFFRKVCMTLEPSIVLPLVRVIPLIESLAAKSCLFDVVINKMREDDSMVETLVSSDNLRIVHVVVSVLKKIKRDKSDMQLYKLLKHHDESVRSAALDHFISKPRTILPRLFFLINDPGISVRVKLLKFIGAERSVPSETLMLNYMSSKEFSDADKSHTMNCYRTLGQCGAQRTIQFLKDKLSGKNWKKYMGAGKSFQRDGAIAALNELNLPEAKSMLKNLSKR